MIIPFIKNINFFELAKFMKIAKPSVNNKPLYKLPNSSESLPLSTITSINIPSIGKSNDPFIAGCLRDSTQEQIYNISDHIALCYMGYIKHSISALEEWSAVIHLSGFTIPLQGTPERGCDLVNSDDFHFHLYYYSYFSSYMEVVLQDGVQSPTIADNGFTRQHCALNGDRIRINVDRTWMQNNGIGRIFKIGVKNNTVYFYIDDTLIGYQAKTLSIDTINIGEFPQRLQYFDLQYHAYVYDIQDFSIYDKFIFDIPAYGYLSGNPPFTFNSNGNPLVDYTISGNTIQSGTPTPDNPIMPQGTGEKTGNLFDKTTLENGIYLAANGNKYGDVTNGVRAGVKIKVLPNTAYTLSAQSSANVTLRIFEWSNGTFTTQTPKYNISGNISLTVTTDAETTEITFNIEGANGQYATNIMLNTGETALSYEPYGYKIPISSANTTTPVYLGEVETTRKIKKLVLTGEESWAEGSTNYYSRLYSKGRPYSNALCTHAKNASSIDNNGTYLYLQKSTFMFETLADFKAYLAAQYAAGTPVTVWYVLENEETGIVNEPLMKIVDYADTLSMEQAGVEIPTINGSNTLTVDTTIQPSEVSIVYENKIP